MDDKDDDDMFVKVPSSRAKSEEEIKMNTSKKSLILVGISIILIIVALVIILYFVFHTNIDDQNYIIAKFMIKNTTINNTIFYHTFKDSIDTMKINDTEVDINNYININQHGLATIELKFKNKLQKLDNLFYYANTLEEVDLSFLFD